jgi:hypothetical protein
VPEPRAADGQRGREQHPLARLAGERGEPLRHVHVGRRQHAGGVELAQDAGDAGGERGVHRPRSSTSLSASTTDPEGRQANTPPSPVMPRRNR